jgi:MFS family permease
MMSAVGKPAASEWKARPRVVAITLLAGVLAAAHVGKLPPALPSIRAEIGLDIVTAGWLASMFGATGSLIAMFLGAAADRIDHWRLAVGGLALMAISGVAGSLAFTGAQLTLSRLFEGIGFLGVVVAAPSIIAQASSGRARNAFLGIWAGYLPGGVSIMILAAPFVLQAAGWRVLWVVLALPTLLTATAMYAFGQRASRDDTGPPPETTLRHNIGGAISRPGPWLLAGCFALYGAQLYAIIIWMPTFMIEERGIGAAAASGLTGVLIVANGTSSVLGSYLLRQGAVPWAMIAVSGAVMLLSAAGALVSTFSDVLRYLFSVILCSAGGVVASGVFAIAPSIAPSSGQLGTINGMLVQASNLAQFVGPAAVALGIAMSGHWDSALWLMLGANILLILSALLVHRQLGKAPII